MVFEQFSKVVDFDSRDLKLKPNLKDYLTDNCIEQSVGHLNIRKKCGKVVQGLHFDWAGALILVIGIGLRLTI